MALTMQKQYNNTLWNKYEAGISRLAPKKTSIKIWNILHSLIYLQDDNDISYEYFQS